MRSICPPGLDLSALTGPRIKGHLKHCRARERLELCRERKRLELSPERARGGSVETGVESETV